MAVKTALEALDAALATGGTPPPSSEVDEELPETPSGEENDEETPPTGDEDDGAGETDGEDGEDAGETDGEAGDGDETEETDEEKAARETEEAAAETPEAKAAREKAEKAAERGTGDILEDPIPKDLNQRTQTRMRSLIETVKELQPDAEIGRELMGHINQSMMTADEFNMALTFGRLKHSDNVEDNRKAYSILMQGLKELAPIIGETLPGVDLLEGHPDLAQQVKEGKLDPKIAAEAAAGRNRRKAEGLAATRAQENQQTANQRAQQQQQQAAAVKKELNELGADLSANDPQFEAKMRAMSKEQKAKINATPLGLRVNAFLKTYMAIKLAPKGAAPAVGKKPGPQPLRAGKVPAAGGNGVRRAPKSAVEAMDFALGLK
jgi:hypothetical protein